MKLQDEVGAIKLKDGAEKVENLRSKKFMLKGESNANIVDKIFTQRRNLRIREPLEMPSRGDSSSMNDSSPKKSTSKSPRDY